MNEHDSEVLAGTLEQMGYQLTAREEEADLILLNTCCVREKAENKVFGRLGTLKKLKEANPEVILGVCGCMVQQPKMADKIRQRMPHMDLIFGTHNIHELPQLIAQAQCHGRTQLRVWEKEGGIVEQLPIRRSNRLKAYVNIMYGCNNFCSYCIVPYVRGRERSRRPEDVIAEVRQLVEQGFVEVMLLGQNVNSYGKDLSSGMDFADLLKQVNQVEGLRRIRFMTSHPRDFTDKLIDTLGHSDKICEHYHLPVQSGSSAVLKKMNRGYSRERYLELIEKVKSVKPRASITTDIIVGFPGESDQDFEDTISLIEQVRFDGAYMFIYSPRSGTPAAKLENQVPDDVKKARFQRLLNRQNDITEELNRQMVGRVEPVLFEGVSKNDAKIMAGRTRTNKIVHVPADARVIGGFYRVRIVEAQRFSLSGEIIEEIQHPG